DNVIKQRPIDITTFQAAMDCMQPAPAFFDTAHWMIVFVIINLEEALCTTFSRDKRTICFCEACGWQDDIDVFMPIKQLMVKGNNGFIRQDRKSTRLNSSHVKISY